jgi:hypothetical protein
MATDRRRANPPDRTKSSGGHQYDARFRERNADRLAAAGDVEGARLERAAAEESRAASRRRPNVPKSDPLAGAAFGRYRISR